jgi:LmbE family N-acetylglucosaminyl deacetylase
MAPGGRVYAPLAAGGHIDHRLVRQAAEDWWASRIDQGAISWGHSAENAPETGVQSASKDFSSKLKSLIYYEDYPYTEQAERLVTVLGDGHWWRAERIPLDEPSMAAKIAAVGRYRSQISTFFQGLDEMAERLRAYARRAGSGEESAERYWHKKRP